MAEYNVIEKIGARSRNRTGTVSPPRDFKGRGLAVHPLGATTNNHRHYLCNKNNAIELTH
jgi:hypothetical protein